MPKSKGNKRKQQGGGTANWSAADHAERQQQKQAKRQRKEVKQPSNNNNNNKQQRTALLSHDTFDKRQQLKLKLHFTKQSRNMEQLKRRLEQWDPVLEAQRQKEEEAEQKKQLILQQEQEQGIPKQKWRRPGPETWKLKGAARPAHEVYDFDTRYTCPHQKAHEDYKVQQARLQNLLQVPLVNNNSDRAAAVLRDYLSTLMQCGHLQVEMGTGTPIPYWQECLTLERLHSLHLTTAQRDILQWYMERGDYVQAEQFLLQHQHPATDGESSSSSDVWRDFASAWLAVELKRTDTTERMMHAIRNNPFCAYYLAFFETFDSVFEYQNELQEADDVPQSSLEEAIEFCASDGAGEMWRSNGADQILKGILMDTLEREPSNDGGSSGDAELLTWKDLEWRSRLERIEEAYKKQRSNDDNEDEDEEGKGPDISMYAEMFRTSMDMLEQAGTIPKLS